MNTQRVKKLPEHVALIMDGNGRWAKQRGLPRSFGHKAGVEALREIVTYCSDIGIKILTVFAFSTENWARPAEEVDYLINILLVEFMKKEIDELNRNNVRIKILGDVEELPSSTKKQIYESIEKTKHNTGLQFNIALNYGGRNEIIDAVKKIARMTLSGEIDESDIDEDLLSGYLYTSGDKDPDLIIRTSGEKRISNFLLWQGAYSELYFSEVLWPDFKKENLIEAIDEYEKRDRRFGGVK
ncbi:isoprenyl transferase [Lutispora saccharofermentans]|uniref:Isoprenyl transferase n=1 Tax=Lutispora saccharofermentans TaxID=3024236 RepID=A0ABT1N9P3_9FIRM|nr:isoprenyl transferase [Lutispora saccharofermentans]MCQ1527963.1 isoprenyl transferase [Lutispora saccharofermentans]